MATLLIVSRSPGRTLGPTGKSIDLEEWLQFVANDASLRLRSGPVTAANPMTGETVTIPATPGQTELDVGGEAGAKWVPFLGYRRGALAMRFSEGMNQPEDPVRKKVAEVARVLGARIRTDAADEFLDW